MKRQTANVFAGVYLILLGTMTLLNNLSILPSSVYGIHWFWLGAFGLAGMLFLAAFLANPHESWWTIIPAFTLLGLAGLSSIPALQGSLGNSFFLGMVSLSFWVIYFTHHDLWWAILPGGVLLTLAGMAGYSAAAGHAQDTGGFFFLGLALTFLLVYLLPTPGERQHWALWPAAILGIIGSLMALQSSDWTRFIWPVALIVLGGFLIYHTFTRRVE